MYLKKKSIFIFTTMLVILFIIPFVFTKIVQPHEFMGIMIFLFFIINPITTMIINLTINKDIKKLWLVPILFSIIFLLSYWLILNEIILDLFFYATIYLIIGLFFMFCSFFIPKTKKSKTTINK